MSAHADRALASLPESRRRILEHVKRHGESVADAIAGELGVTTSGVRQHLTALERDGWLAHRVARGGAGRPKHLFALTPAGDALFPRAYAELTNELLDYVEDEDPALLTRIFDRRAARRLQRTRARAAGLPFADRVRVVAEVLDEDGYLADFAPANDGGFVITEHNCAVLAVAARHRHACSSELAYLQAALPDAEVRRIAHRLNGGHVCAYLVRPSADADSIDAADPATAPAPRR
ncbi:MAG TPA: winged helix-turn-helix transcriptional regulator [Thermomicrobiales bacterium]|nr:winged helix-turn-helix transcriptional regulator [Thermomicrobiales bacterium]